jgi:hypothetical protein
MGLIDQALGLVGRGREHAFDKHMQEALGLREAGRTEEARALYEQLVVEATELHGADAELTLLTRGCLANTYQDDPERAVQLLEQIVEDGEGLYGPVDDGRLAPRLDLALAYGRAGDYAKCHKLSEELLADCDRLLGPEHRHTVKARYLAEESASELARAELAAFLEAPRDSFAEELAPTDWQERLLAGASTIEAARSYRARMIWDSKSPSGASDDGMHFEYDFEFVRPDRFHLGRDTGQDFDEWIVLGDEHYRNAGLWLPVDNDETKEEHEREDGKLLAASYLDLLRGTAPIAVSVLRGEQGAYLAAEYATVTEAWSDFFEGAASPREARTSIWVDVATGLLRRAEGSFVIMLPPEDGTEATEAGTELGQSFKHGFTSYDEDIVIERPETAFELDDEE